MSNPRPGRGLGRGLASLIPDSALEMNETSVESKDSLKTVPIGEIQPNPEQPRTVFDPTALEELTSSIRAYGILSPLIVRRSEGRYILIAGERRLRAAMAAGLKEVPIVVREAEAASRQLELALVENLQRSDLDPVESAKGFQRLIDEHGYTQDRVAEAVGKDRSTIANAVRLLRLPEFALNKLREGLITAGHARALLSLSEDEQINTVLSKIIEHQLNVRETERCVEMMKKAPTAVVEQRPRERSFEYAIKVLEEALHTNVTIKAGPKGGGRIIVDYSDGEDLDRLISLLKREEA